MAQKLSVISPEAPGRKSIILLVEEYAQLPIWLALCIYLPTIVLLTLGLLPRCKGIILALLWMTKAEGSEKL